MIQYRLELQELAEILKEHFGVEGPAQVDLTLTHKAGRAAEGDGPAFPTIVTQITGVLLTLEETPKTPSRPAKRVRRQRRSPAKSRATRD